MAIIKHICRGVTPWAPRVTPRGGVHGVTPLQSSQRSFLVNRVKAFGVLILCLAFFQVAAAQQTITSASLSGRVEDATGSMVSGATVTITHRDTSVTQQSSSDAHGEYRFPYLPVGAYQLSVTAPGFAPAPRELTLLLGQTINVVVRLAIAEVAEQVNVTSDVTLLDTSRTQLSGTIRPQEIDELPLNGRNYLDLALLIPGVSRTNTGSNQRFAETSAVPGQGLSIAGQRNLNNSFVVDGVSANDDAADLTGTYYSQDVIREFQVVTSGGIAEFGRASAGVVNILTQSGTNSWHGRGYGFLRNQRFDARNPLAPTKDPLTQAQYGTTISGPLKRDRTFVFGNFEQTRRNDATVVTISTAAVSSINNRLRQSGYAGSLIQTGLVPGGFDTTNFFARVDHRLGAKNFLTARYSFYQIDSINSRNVGGLNAQSRGTALANTDQSLVVSNVTTISSRSLNEARFQFTRSRLKAPVNDNVGPAVNIAGVANFGTATFSPLGRDIDLIEFVDNVSTQRGRHSLKAGVDLLYNRVNIFFPGAVQGVYTFSSLNNFLTGNYATYQQAFGEPTQFQSNPNIGVFVQDEWRPFRKLTINAGLRYDAQFLPNPIRTDGNNFAPRLGVAYAPNSRTVVRGSFGIYFDRIPLRATSNALQRDGSKYIVAQFSPVQAGAPVFPNVLTGAPSSLLTKPNITRIDPDITASYSEQLNLQIERELGGDTFISVGYLHLRGLHLIVSRNLNVPRFPAAAGVPNLGRPDPNWGNISQFESSGDSHYNALVLSVNKRAGRWASARVSYTLSKAIDNTGNFFFSTPQNNFDLRAEQGLSDNNQRHRLVLSGTLEAPANGGTAKLERALRGFQLSYIFTYSSRLPFNVLLGSDRNFDTNTNDRPVGVGRNTGRGFDFASFDLRLARRFRLTERVALQLLAEGFNLFNRANLGIPNNTFGGGATAVATFGRPTAAFEARQFQFGLKLSY